MTVPDLDIIALHILLDREFGPGDISAQRISGGQSNPTYRVAHGEQRMILRKQPPGPLLRGAHAIDREYRVMSALRDTGVPVPRLILYHDDPDPLGTPFYLMEEVQGRVFSDATLPEIAPDERGAIYLSMARTLAALHNVDPVAIGLSDFGKHGVYFERQLSRWSRQVAGSTLEGLADLRQLEAMLKKALPPDDGITTIAHGDFRLGNLMFAPDRAEVVAVLDWELSTLGHPMADLGFCVMPWHSSPDEYGGLLGQEQISLGIPDEGAFITAYYDASERDTALSNFHIAFALYRFAAIFVGIAERVKDGTAAGDNAQDLAPLARRFALRGLEVMEGRAHAS